MRIITHLVAFAVFFDFSAQNEYCGDHKYSAISCSRFLKCVEGQWREFSCPVSHNFDEGFGKCLSNSKCRPKRSPGILDYGIWGGSHFGIKRIPTTGPMLHSSIHHGHSPMIYDHPDDEIDRSGSTTFKKFRYSTRSVNGDTKTTMWYYNSNGPNYKFTIYGELPAPKEHMIEWLEKNSHNYKTTNVPYLGDAPEDPKTLYNPPQVSKPHIDLEYGFIRPEIEYEPKRPKPEYEHTTTKEEYEHKKPKPAEPVSQEKETKQKLRPITPLSWMEILPIDCGFKGNVVPNTVKDKIVNGEAVGIEANPWQVAIMDKNTKTLRCGGSIISKNHVLTAAHCFVAQKRVTDSNGKRKSVEAVLPKSDRIIYAGNDNINDPLHQFSIVELYIHSKYSTNHKRNDVALILVDGDFNWSAKIYPICLPDKKANYDARRACRISGWGKKASEISATEDNLLAAEVKIVSTKDCKRENEQHLNISRGMFCAGDYENGSVDSCQGDSGGPCTCEENDRSTLFGITSWGIGCGRAKYPGVYVKVSLYLNWIKDRLELSYGGSSRDFSEDRDIGGPDDDEEDDDVDEDII